MEDPRTITVVEDLPHAPKRVWRALTDSEIMARWMMPNDFRPRVGHEFRMTGVPVPAVNFSGIVLCKVLELVEDTRLKISWTDDKRLVDWTVTWSLEPIAGGTRLTMRHEGFDPEDPRQSMSRKVMGGGWPGMHSKFAALLDELEAV